MKIAVADDERDSREFLQEYLTLLGHEVRGAEDGRALVAACHEFLPDVVVTDYAMPGMDGLDAAAEINRARRVPVVLITGRYDVPPADGSFIVARLLKPVKLEALKAAVEAAMRARDVREQGD